MMYEFSYNAVNSSENMNSPNNMNSSEYMSSPNNMNSSEYMNSPEDMNSSEYMNSLKDMNSSENMNSPNNMNSSDYMNSYVPPCVIVPDKELDVLTNGHDKSNALDDTSEMCIYTDCIDTAHAIQICTVPVHMI
jgi:hypothetical protein